MPKTVRMKVYFVACDIEAYVLSEGGMSLMPELRRFTLHVEDADDGSSNALYEQLVQKIHTTFGTDLMPKGQPFRLYWKDKDVELIAFYSSSELLHAIEVMNQSEVGSAATTTTAKPSETSNTFISYDSLKIYIFVPGKVKAGNECGRVTQAPPQRVPPIHSPTLLPITSATKAMPSSSAAISPSTTGNKSNISTPETPALETKGRNIKMEMYAAALGITASQAFDAYL